MTLWNYAIGAVATASSTQGGYPPEQAKDGSEETYWRTAASASPWWWKADLGAPQYITEVNLVGCRGWDRPGGTLQYSADDTNWNNLTTFPAGPAGSSAEWYYALPVDGVTARYWRVTGTQTSGDWIGIDEVEILGPVPAPPPPTNPAPDYIAAWLDGIEANYVPGVEAWLASN